MMAAWGMHLDFPPDAAGGALFPYLESMANQAFGMVIGRGGADAIVKAMTGLIKAKGGEIRLNSPVAKIEAAAGGAPRRAPRRRDADCGEEGGRRQPASADRVRSAHGSRA